MALAVGLRLGGKSLRSIAADLHVGVATVHRDLSRWECQQAESMIAAVPLAVPSGPERNSQRNTLEES